MLDGDERPNAEQAAQAFRDHPIAQFWDGAQTYGTTLAHSLGADGWVAWDIYLFYPPGTAWTDAGMPPPEAALAQVGGVGIATKGTLPPVAPQGPLPQRTTAGV